jgi:hypothetical protein
MAWIGVSYYPDGVNKGLDIAVPQSAIASPSMYFNDFPGSPVSLGAVGVDTNNTTTK